MISDFSNPQLWPVETVWEVTGSVIVVFLFVVLWKAYDPRVLTPGTFTGPPKGNYASNPRPVGYVNWFGKRDPGDLQKYWARCIHDPASTIVHQRPVLSAFDSDAAVAQVSAWLAACQQSHTHCAGLNKPWLPVRLIDLAADECQSRIRLRSTSGLYGAYVTLSYCWGQTSQPVTTLENIAEREAGISLEILPQTIRDTIFFTRKLGVRYLWIDALCIIQDDDDDRHAQITSMANIYKNALLTIAASDATSVWNGFLRRSSEPRWSVRLPFKVSPSVYGSVNIGVQGFYDNWGEPLHLRSWTMQELLLSRKIILFGKFELIWRCSTEKWLPSQTSSILYSSSLNLLPRQVFGAVSYPQASLLKQQQKIWPDVVSQFSKRKATISMDRISALVGIATELSTAWRDVYILGLWSRIFVQNLAWRVGAQQEVCSQRLSGNVPSWSWLSLECRTEMWPVLRNADANLVPPSGGLQQIMTVRDIDDQCTTIQLRARTLTDTSMLQIPFKTSEQVHSAGGFTYWLDKDIEDYEVTYVDMNLIVPLLGYVYGKPPSALCLLLGRCATAGSTEPWQRIGRLRIWDFDWSTVSYSVFTVK